MKYYFSSNFLIPTVTSILNYFIIQQIKFTIFKAMSKLIAIQLLNRHPRCNKLVALWVDSHGHEFQFQLSKCLPFLSKCKNTFYANSYKRAIVVSSLSILVSKLLLFMIGSLSVRLPFWTN